MRVKSKFWGKSMEIQPVGMVHVHLPKLVTPTNLPSPLISKGYSTLAYRLTPTQSNTNF